MARYLLRILFLVWGSLIIILGLSLYIASTMPSDGTILLTNDLLLNNEERFHLYDISRQQSYRFTPDTGERTFSVSLAPRHRRLASLRVEGNRFFLEMTDFTGQLLLDSIPVNNILDFDEAHWSSSASLFMYYDDPADRRGASIFIMSIASGEQLEIPMNEILQPSATWSPGETRIAYTDSGEGESVSQIWIADADGTNQFRLTDNDNASYCPAWSPSGDIIAYLESVPSGDQLHYVAVDTAQDPAYTEGIWRITGCPVWTADGKSILFISLDGETRQTSVMMLDVESGHLQNILTVNQTTSLQLWQ